MLEEKRHPISERKIYMRKELEKTYDPQSFEDRIYKFWLDNHYFTAKRDPEKKPYTIVIPPPNITGQLHMAMHWTKRCRTF